jgi:hypothetical protein
MTGSPGWHHRDAVELAGEHGVDPTRGLDASDVAHRIARHGANELTGKAASSWLALLADQFKDFMVLVLIAAAVVSGAIGELVDTLAIVVIVVLNAVIGFVQAWRADKAMAALQQLAAAHATVLRDSEVRRIPAAGLVPGDIVLLEAGQPGAGRPAADRSGPVPHGRVGTDWRIRHGREARRANDRRCSRAGRQAQHGLQGNHRHARKGARSGRGHGHEHRTGEGGDAAGPRHRSQHTAAAPPGGLRQKAVAGCDRHLRGALHRGCAARRTADADGADSDQPGRGGHPGGVACGGHGAAGAGRAKDGDVQRTDPTASFRGDPGFGQLHLLRQNRHADAKPDARRGVAC